MILHLLPAQILSGDTRRLPAQRLFERGLNPLLRLLAQRDGGRFAYLACPFGVVLPNEVIDSGELVSARSLSRSRRIDCGLSRSMAGYVGCCLAVVVRSRFTGRDTPTGIWRRGWFGMGCASPVLSMGWMTRGVGRG